MTYHADASPLHGDGELTSALAVGWLDADHPYATGECPHEVLTAIEDAVRHPVAATRGWHGCPFCDSPGFGPMRHVTTSGDEVVLGTAEAEFKGPEGRTWRGPTLMLHYVTAHSYLPPDAFRDDVTRGR